MVARVKAVLRRANPAPADNGPGLTLDEERYEAVMGTRRVAPDRHRILPARPPWPVTRDASGHGDQLMDEIYQDHRVVSDRTIDSHIRKLRRKLSEEGHSDHDWIGSVYGVGYRLEQP